MGAQGSTTINFGAAPGANEASVAVTGQATILAGSQVEAWIMAVALGDHTANDHEYVALLAEFTCGSVVAGTGFTITGRCTEQLEGTFTIQWVWN